MKSSPVTGNRLRRRQKSKSKIASPIVLNAAGGELKGEIRLLWEPCRNARYYLLQKCTTLSRPYRWKYEDMISSANCTVSNLKSNRNYMFRVAVMTETGKGPWSKPVIKKAP